MKRIGWLIVFGFAGALPLVAGAQYRDRDSRDGERRDGERREGERRDGERRGFDPRQWVEGMDANKNGIIEPSELSERSARFLQRAADQAGLKAGEPWPVDKLLGAMGRRDETPSSSNDSNRPAEAPRTESAPKATPSNKVPILGFGEKDGGVKIPSFETPPLGGVAPARIAITGAGKQYDDKVVARVDDLLREADTNRNGYLDPDEIKAYRNWSTPPEESDLDKDGRLSRSELLERIAKRASRGSSSSSGSTSGPARGSESGPPDPAAQAKKYAEGLMHKYDADKSGYLEKDEWKEMKPEHQTADVNKDGVISLDELITRLNALNSGQAGASSGGSSAGDKGAGGSSYGGRYGNREGSRYGGDRSGGKPGDKEAKKPIVRVITPTERLPKGLPDWFLRNDADADGQVSMVEYAAAWSDKTADEFQKYDLNADGFITANEVLTVDKDSKRK